MITETKACAVFFRNSCTVPSETNLIHKQIDYGLYKGDPASLLPTLPQLPMRLEWLFISHENEVHPT